MISFTYIPYPRVWFLCFVELYCGVLCCLVLNLTCNVLFGGKVDDIMTSLIGLRDRHLTGRVLDWTGLGCDEVSESPALVDVSLTTITGDDRQAYRGRRGTGNSGAARLRAETLSLSRTCHAWARIRLLWGR